MSFLDNLWANIKIFSSNFTAKYAGAVNALFWILVIAIIGVVVWRAVVFIFRTSRQTSSIEKQVADKTLADRAAKSLSEAIQIPTISGNREGLLLFKKWLRMRYPNVFAQMSAADLAGGSLILRWHGTSENAPVLFCGHMDTVPAEGQAWRASPFGGKIADGEIFGRGALDCKSVIVAELEAVNRLIAEGFVPSRDVYFAFGCDEETGGNDGAAKIAKVFEDKGVLFDFIIDEGGYISPAHLGCKKFPAALIGVAEKGVATYRVSATTHASHAAMPPAHTTLGTICECVCRIEQAPMHKKLLPIVRRSLRYSAPALPLIGQAVVANIEYSKNLFYHFTKHNLHLSTLFHTTFAATQACGSAAANALPELAEASINVRILQGDTTQGVMEHLCALLADLPVTVEMIHGHNPSKITQVDGMQYGRVAAAIEETFGHLACVPIIIPMSTDTKHYEPLSQNILRFMPFVADEGQIAAIHGPDERISCESLAQGVMFYQNVLRKI